MGDTGLGALPDLEGARAGFWIAVDKPLGWTSFDVVAKVRNALKRRYGTRIKIGHAGTLDPLATGMLVLAVGRKTKDIESVMAGRKAYLATIRLGSHTDSYDSETPEQPSEVPVPELSAELASRLQAKFTGLVMQVPPIYSALKVDGQRAYSLARSGKAVQLEARPVQIDSLELRSIDHQTWEALVRCGKGTYIRSLAHDQGQELG